MANGSTLQLYYAIRYKGHFGQEWTNIESSYLASGSDFTEKTYVIATLFSHEEGYLLIPDNSQVDFQVQAIIGHYYTDYLAHNVFSPSRVFSADRSSAWSIIQTIKTPEVSLTVSPMPLPSVPELSWSMIVPLLLSLVAVALVLSHKKSPT